MGNRTRESIKMLVIGGRGKMGSRLVTEFKDRVREIEVLDIGDAPRKDAISAFDVVMLAVSMHRASEVAAEIAPLVRPDALIVDVNSLKSEICSIFRSYCRGEALGTHPMFGPSVSSFKGQKVVLCPIKEGPLSAWFKEQLADLGCELVTTDPENHDRAMAVVQVLNHFGMMVMGEALRKMGVPIEESLRFTSPIYLLELSMVGRLFGQSPELYAEIARANPFGSEARNVFLQAASEMEELLEQSARDPFCERFLEIRKYFDNFSERAQKLSNSVIDTIVNHR